MFSFFFFFINQEAKYFFDNVDEPEALRLSLRLWPDPTDAPDVPPDSVLLDFVKHPHLVKPVELQEQIRKSINCRRAIDVLLTRLGKHPMQELGLLPRAGRANKATLSGKEALSLIHI